MYVSTCAFTYGVCRDCASCVLFYHSLPVTLRQVLSTRLMILATTSLATVVIGVCRNYSACYTGANRAISPDPDIFKKSDSLISRYYQIFRIGA